MKEDQWDGGFYADKIRSIAEAVEKAPKIGETDGMEQHPVVLRYFHPTGTETLVTEIGDDGEAFGFQCLSGDYQNAEWGYLDLNETVSTPLMEMDYHVPEGMSVERWLYQEEPDMFPEYRKFAARGKGSITNEKVSDESSLAEGLTFEQSENLRKSLDNYFDNGARPENDRFIIGKTPLVLQKTGSDLTEVTVPVSVIKKAVETHGLSRKEIYESLSHIYNPILIFDSDKNTSENKHDSKLVLTDVFKDNKPVALAINVNDTVQIQDNGHRNSIEVQDIRSIHDRTVIAKNGTDLIRKWTEEGLCRYVDDKKITDWSTIARVYFPVEVLQSDDHNILIKSALVKDAHYDEPAGGYDFTQPVNISDRFAIDIVKRDHDREPVIRFIDRKYNQITTGSYYISTVLEHEKGTGLALDLDEPEWTVDAESILKTMEICEYYKENNWCSSQEPVRTVLFSSPKEKIQIIIQS